MADRKVIFVGVHPARRAQWPRLRAGLSRLDLRFVQGENLNRARFHMQQIVLGGSYRIVVVVDPFEDWPTTRFPGRNTPDQYASFVFDVQRRSRGTENAVAFLLHHHSRALDDAPHALGKEQMRRLRDLPLLPTDLSDDDLEHGLQEVWRRLQQELLEAARPRSQVGSATTQPDGASARRGRA